MAEQLYYIGPQGPFIYDDAAKVNENLVIAPAGEAVADDEGLPSNYDIITGDAPTVTDLQVGMRSEGKMIAKAAPSAASEVLRFDDAPTTLATASHELATVASIDLTVLATTTILTATAAQVLEALVMICKTASGVGGIPEIELRINGGALLVPQSKLTGFNAVNEIRLYVPTGTTAKIVNTDVVELEVVVAATGTLTMQVDLRGYDD